MPRRTLPCAFVILSAAALSSAPAQSIRTLPGTYVSGSLVRDGSEIVLGGSTLFVSRSTGGGRDPFVTGYVTRLRLGGGFTRTQVLSGYLNHLTPDGVAFVGAQYRSSDVSSGIGTAVRGTDQPSVSVTPLPPPPIVGGSAALGISADKSVVVGWITVLNNRRAAAWTGNGIAQDLGVLPGRTTSQALAVSANGSVIVGESDGVPFRWSSGDGMVALPLPAGATAARAVDISDDGQTILIVPTQPNPTGTTSALWTQGGGLQPLGNDFGAVTMAADATRVFGHAYIAPGAGTPMLWTSTAGLRSFLTVARDDYGLALARWGLRGAFGMSDDGTTFAVGGTTPQGYEGLQLISLTDVLPSVPPLVEVSPQERAYRLRATGPTFAIIQYASANATRFIVTGAGGYRRSFRLGERKGELKVPLQPGMNIIRVTAIGAGGRATAVARLKARRLPAGS